MKHKKDSSSVDATVNVWSLSSDSQDHQILLDNILKKSNNHLKSCLFVIVVDLSKPWSALSCLETWIGRLNKLLNSFSNDPSHANVYAEMKEEHQKYIQQRYAGINYSNRNTLDGGDDALDLPMLPEGMLEVNMGVPLIVVGCNSEYLYKPQSSITSQYKSNLLQVHLRKVCYQRGASLVFVPSERFLEENNASSTSSSKITSSSSSSSTLVSSGLLLQQYLLHRLYPNAFRYLSDDFDFDPTRPDHSLLITSGQDSLSAIDSLVIGDLKTEDDIEKYFPLPKDHVMDNNMDNKRNIEEEEEDDDGKWIESVKNSMNATTAKRAILSPVAIKKKAPAVEVTTEVSELPSSSSSSTKTESSKGSSSSSSSAAAATAAGKKTAPPPPPPPPAGRSTRGKRESTKEKGGDKAKASDFFTSLM
jgi:hypothetical protein